MGTKGKRMPKYSWYAVRKGREIGVYTTWAECSAQVNGYSGAQYAGFKSQAEAAAFVAGGAVRGAVAEDAGRAARLLCEEKEEKQKGGEVKNAQEKHRHGQEQQENYGQHKYLLKFDGGAAPTNPGPAGGAAVLWEIDEEGELTEMWNKGVFLPHASNNVAEYSALLCGLEECVATGITRDLAIAGDSQLVIRQLEGRFQVKKADLVPLHERARKLLGQIKNYSLTHVLREFNKRCDELADHAIAAEAGW